jgi:hypothetical protein
MLAKVDPHIIWFPAVRHESYCYILDSVFDFINLVIIILLY